MCNKCGALNRNTEYLISSLIILMSLFRLNYRKFDFILAESFVKIVFYIVLSDFIVTQSSFLLVSLLHLCLKCSVNPTTGHIFSLATINICTENVADCRMLF